MTDSSSDREQHFLDAVKAELDASAAALDSVTVARLEQRRRTALRSCPSRPTWWIPAGAFATLAVAITTIFLWTAAPTPESDGLLEDLDLLSSIEDIEFYDELDFYLWLNDDVPAG
ncbi:MAG: hypothetical protein V2J55_00030 [Candidatus Competibacteraceae bacterium]|jgi:hypothetical protein|nr:hypothetical protein [Candidatus Competibacteraceae bacterium]